VKITLTIEEYDLLELIHYARRYCDGRYTGAPDNFNAIYDRLRTAAGVTLQEERSDAHVVTSFPYATYGPDKKHLKQ
jgi:hypothetical protein